MFARTKRLTLRPGWPEDAAELAKAIAHESVVTMLAHVPWPYTVDDAAWFLDLPRAAEEPRFVIVAHDRTQPRLVGGIALDATDEAGTLELGYWLTPSAWGRGYATEAARAAVEMARHALPARRLIARPAIENHASAHVLTKLGFRETGRTEPWRCRATGHDREATLLELDVDIDQPALLAA